MVTTKLHTKNSYFNHQSHATWGSIAQYLIQTYCSPTESCTGHLWSYSDLRNSDPEEEEANDDEERTDKQRNTFY